MVESALKTANNPDEIDFLVYVDNDDREEYPEYVIHGEALQLAPAYQYLYELSTANILMMAADDLIFRTKGWDTELLKIIPDDDVFVCSFDDLGRPKKENGHPFIGRQFVELLGYFTYPKLKHSCVDNWVVDIAIKSGKYLYADFIIEHVHPKYQKGGWDSTYTSNSKEIKKADGNIYFGEGQAEINKAVERIKRFYD